MNDLDNEKEWRRMIYNELVDLRKDIQGFKLKTISFLTSLTILLNIAASYIIKK